MTTPRCAAGADPTTCCTPGAWERMATLGLGAWHTLGEPLPEQVIDVAAQLGVEPHALDYHVEGVHGYEPHDTGYRDAVEQAARCLLEGGTASCCSS